MAGRQFGQKLNQGRWGQETFPGGFTGGYNFRSMQVHGTRLLYHSGLDLQCLYTGMPSSTKNFSWDLLTTKQSVSTVTLASTKFSLYTRGPNDVVIKEVWDPVGGASMEWVQFHCLHQMFTNCPDWANGESLIWRPMDRNCKVYTVDFVNMVVDGVDLTVDRIGDDPDLLASKLCAVSATEGAAGSNQARNFLMKARVEVHLRLRPEDEPNAAVFLQEGSQTAETAEFESE